MNPVLSPLLGRLDAMQRDLRLVSLRKYENDELQKMEADPAYKSPLAVLREPYFRELAQRIPALQSMIHHSILEEHKNRFDAIVRGKFSNQERYDLSAQVEFGTIITPKFVATTRTFPDCDGSLILFDEILWEGLRYMSDIMSAPLCAGDAGSPFFTVDFERAKQHCDRFAEVLWRIVNRKHLYGIEILPETYKAPVWKFIWAEFHTAMESFLFGHEYAHVLRHHDLSEKTSVAGKWANEYEADLDALDMVMMSKIEENSQGDAGGQYRIMMHLCGCYLLFLFFDLIEEFEFDAVSSTGTHPPTLFRLASFKRKCFEQMGRDGFDALDGLLQSLHDLLDFYVRHAANQILRDSPVAGDLGTRVVRAVQKSIFWSVMRSTQDEMIHYLDTLVGKFEAMPLPAKKQDSMADDPLGEDSLRNLAPYLGWQVLAPKGAEKLLEDCLRMGLLDRSSVLKLLCNCREVYQTNKAALEIGLARSPH